jgi:hypothetical protein
MTLNSTELVTMPMQTMKIPKALQQQAQQARLE